MHGDVFLQHCGVPVRPDEGDAFVEKTVTALGEAGEIDDGAQDIEAGFAPPAQMNVAEAEDGQHDHQLQVATADISDLIGHDGFLKALGTG